MDHAAESEALLALWERALAQPEHRRADALVGATAVCTLGERNARLAAVHTRLFGRRLELASRCPACGEAAQFEGDCEVLAAAPDPGSGGVHRLEFDDCMVEFRLPRGEDIDIAAAGHVNGSTGSEGDDDDEAFARRLIGRCILSSRRGDTALAVAELPVDMLDRISRRMEALEPAAGISFALACPACARQWSAPLDLARVVWQKLQRAAERMLVDVDTLARAYGWREADVMALSATRRAAYLQLAAA